MLLRASSDAVGAEVDLSATVEDAADGGVEDGAVLTAFAEAVVRAAPDLDAVRATTVETLGPARFVEAAATVGIFNGLVRVADSTGIPSDPETLAHTEDIRSPLGINGWNGAAASGVAETRPSPAGRSGVAGPGADRGRAGWTSRSDGRNPGPEAGQAPPDS